MKMVLNDGETPAPAETHIKIASNGTFISLSNPTFNAVVPCNTIPDLKPVEPQVTWKLPPIPRETFGQVLRFFREVSDKMHTEVAVLLFFGPKSGWVIASPPQVVLAAHVDYEMAECVLATRKVYPDVRCVGTIHSHVNMGAHHSGTDTRDEAEFDGLHITIGRVGELPEAFDMDAEIVVRGRRFKVGHDVFTEGLVKNGDPSDEDENDADSYGTYGTIYGTYGQSRWNPEPSHGFVDDEFIAAPVPEEWWVGVRKGSWNANVTKFVTRTRRHWDQ